MVVTEKAGPSDPFWWRGGVSSVPHSSPAWGLASLWFAGSSRPQRLGSQVHGVLQGRTSQGQGLGCDRSLQSQLLTTWARGVSNKKGGTQVWWVFSKCLNSKPGWLYRNIFTRKWFYPDCLPSQDEPELKLRLWVCVSIVSPVLG